MWNLKRNDTNELIYKMERDSQTKRMNLWLPEGEEPGEGIVRGFRIDMYTLLYLKWITNKLPVYSTWNCTQCYMPAWMGEGFRGEGVHVYLWLNPFTVHLKLP